MKSITTRVEIEAGASEVWAVLTDFESYSDWNPFIVSASGVAGVGESLEIEMVATETKTMKFTPTVTKAEPHQMFEWLGSVGVRGVFDGRHRFELIETPGGTYLEHSEDFSGVLAPVVHRFTGKQTRANFEAMNEALKSKVESGA